MTDVPRWRVACTPRCTPGRIETRPNARSTAFLFPAQVEAEKLDIEPKMQQVWRVGDNVGRTAADAPFEASRVKQRIGWLAKELQEMPKDHEFSQTKTGNSSRGLGRDCLHSIR